MSGNTRNEIKVQVDSEVFVFDQKMQFDGVGKPRNAHAEAEKWLKTNGYSFGPQCGSKPIGVAKGDFWITKWKNIPHQSRKELDGLLFSSNGSATLYLRGEV